jgi:hypothetical protein
MVASSHSIAFSFEGPTRVNVPTIDFANCASDASLRYRFADAVPMIILVLVQVIRYVKVLGPGSSLISWASDCRRRTEPSMMPERLWETVKALLMRLKSCRTSPELWSVCDVQRVIVVGWSTISGPRCDSG